MDAVCKYTVFSIEPVELSWKPVTLKEVITYRLSKSTNSSDNLDTITWDFLVKRDAGYYRCDAKNSHGNDTVILQLRVKGLFK